MSGRKAIGAGLFIAIFLLSRTIHYTKKDFHCNPSREISPSSGDHTKDPLSAQSLPAEVFTQAGLTRVSVKLKNKLQSINSSLIMVQNISCLRHLNVVLEISLLPIFNAYVNSLVPLCNVIKLRAIDGLKPFLKSRL